MRNQRYHLSKIDSSNKTAAAKQQQQTATANSKKI
jgi:hypothetical protein